MKTVEFSDVNTSDVVVYNSTFTVDSFDELVSILKKEMDIEEKDDLIDDWNNVVDLSNKEEIILWTECGFKSYLIS